MMPLMMMPTTMMKSTTTAMTVHMKGRAASSLVMHVHAPVCYGTDSLSCAYTHPRALVPGALHRSHSLRRHHPKQVCILSISSQNPPYLLPKSSPYPPYLLPLSSPYPPHILPISSQLNQNCTPRSCVYSRHRKPVLHYPHSAILSPKPNRITVSSRVPHDAHPFILSPPRSTNTRPSPSLATKLLQHFSASSFRFSNLETRAGSDAPASPGIQDLALLHSGCQIRVPSAIRTVGAQLFLDFDQPVEVGRAICYARATRSPYNEFQFTTPANGSSADDAVRFVLEQREEDTGRPALLHACYAMSGTSHVVSFYAKPAICLHVRYTRLAYGAM
eukprot:1496695-Rhodomonas_salina.1